ncbi:hypothetical protein F5Y16DRAFT_381005 [Xylariaceae sp. FL0255]|nr:hypothetical protein F5Y16DRAFT_381005 [Xylariaceae sp. FL0255]
MNDNLDTLSIPLIRTKVKDFPSQSRNKQDKNRWWQVLPLFLIVTNLISIILLLRNGRHGTRSTADLPALSPVDDSIRYETTYFDKYGHLTSPFAKEPGPELDAAWHQQLAGMNIKVSEEWLERYGADSVHFADGSGVLVQLGVYHELHCLKRIKHWIYPSYYGDNHTDKEDAAHIEHCLEWLRQAALCRGDTTLTTFEWGIGDRNGVLETEYPFPRRCVSPQSLLAWSEERAVDITEPGLLMPPKS